MRLNLNSPHILSDSPGGAQALAAWEDDSGPESVLQFLTRAVLGDLWLGPGQLAAAGKGPIPGGLGGELHQGEERDDGAQGRDVGRVQVNDLDRTVSLEVNVPVERVAARRM